MPTIMDLCFLCTKDYNCVRATEKIVSQVEYLLPEITIIKLGVPLRICTVCDGALIGFSKFKQFSVKNSRRLEAIIKGAQGPPLHTGSPPVVDDNETSDAKPEQMEETFIKEEYLEEPPFDTQMHTDRASLKPITVIETINAEPQNQNKQLHIDTNAGNTEEFFIKTEPIEEIIQDREFYNKILKKEYMSDLMNDDTDSQPEHNTEDESATFNIKEEIWEGSSTDSTKESLEETYENWNKNIETDTKIIIHKTINQDELKTEIQENEENWCYVCTELFVSKALLGRHMKENHSRIKVLSCTVCNKIFTHKYDLNKHMKLHNGIKNVSCSICKKSFYSKRNLLEHIKLHTEQKEINQIKDSSSCSVSPKKFQCDVCDKSFTQKVHVNRHRRIHSGVKDFRCEVCGKLFTHKDTLSCHMRLHYDVKKFPCDVCGKSFTRKDTLDRHIRIHSGFKEFCCDICDKSFTQKTTLNYHMKIHSVEKKFQCEVCNRSFKRKDSLYRHIKIHF